MDIYDQEIEYLTENPHKIYSHWENASPLFRFAGYNKSGCGCLTQVRAGSHAATPELTKAIRTDKRIPTDPDNITLADLPAFAEWQRRINKELNRTAPTSFL